jgi:hypothetical protein
MEISRLDCGLRAHRLLERQVSKQPRRHINHGHGRSVLEWQLARCAEFILVATLRLAYGIVDPRDEAINTMGVSGSTSSEFCDLSSGAALL